MGKFFRDWWQQGQPQPARREPDQLDRQRASNYWRPIMDSKCGLSKFIESKAKMPGESHKMMLGAQWDGLGSTEPDTSILIIGPPRSTGKTAGLIIPNILMARGPVVSVSTKPDVFQATALHRRRQGRIWQFSPDGSDPMPGAEQIRWSPITDDWGECLARGTWMAEASIMSEGVENANFWQSRAGTLLACMFFYAGTTGKDMEWVVETVSNFDIAGELKPLYEDLLARGYVMQGKILKSVITGDARTIGNVFASAGTVLAPYYRPGALATTKDPNFDVEAFCKGREDELNDLVTDSPFNVDGMPWLRQVGVYDTLYLSCSEENMSLAAPLIVGILGDIRRQVLKQHREDELAARMERRAPVYWFLDELFNVPIPDLPTILTDAGSQGLLICAALQSLAQTAKWGKGGASLHTLFNNIVVLPGIREKDALEIWSSLVGNFDQEVWGGSWVGRGNEREWNASQSWQRRPKLEPSDIYRGHPHDPDGALVFAQNEWQWVTLQLYYRSGIWPVLLAVSASLAVESGLGDEGLPYPDLARRNDFRWLNAISPQFAQRFAEDRHAYYNQLKAIEARKQLEAGHARSSLEPPE